MLLVTIFSHIYFFCEDVRLVYLIEVLEIMAQILLLLYIIFLRLKPTKMTSEFILSYLKKGIGGATTQKYQKQKT